MTKSSSANNSSTLSSAPVQEPGDDAIREYAYHLYQQGSGEPGHEVDDWLEATACLKANIPSHSAVGRLPESPDGQKRKGPPFISPEAAERELAILRRERETLATEPMAADSDVRTSLFDDRP